LLRNEQVRIVFMGTPEFAIPSLRAIAAAGHDVPLVVTQPDRIRGRGQRVQRTAVAVAADSLGFPVAQPPKPRGRDFSTRLRQLCADVFVVVAYGHILRPQLLGIPRLGSINAHASLLPHLRGAAPIQWAIFLGDRETGVTTMRMDRGMDTGEILLQRRVPIGERENAGKLHDGLALVAADLLVETLDQLPELQGSPQDHAAATFAPKIEREDLVVDWRLDAEQIDRRVRGLSPSPGARTRRNGDLLKILEAEPLNSQSTAAPGTLARDRAGVIVHCGTGALRLQRVGPAGRAIMSADEYFRGRPLQSANERLGEQR
jgi:methionyl-tRNA formyltransferase